MSSPKSAAAPEQSPSPPNPVKATPAYDPWDEDMDDETGVADPEYYAPPSWLAEAFHEVASEAGGDPAEVAHDTGKPAPGSPAAPTTTPATAWARNWLTHK